MRASVEELVGLHRGRGCTVGKGDRIRILYCIMLEGERPHAIGTTGFWGWDGDSLLDGRVGRRTGGRAGGECTDRPWKRHDNGVWAPQEREQNTKHKQTHREAWPAGSDRDAPGERTEWDGGQRTAPFPFAPYRMYYGSRKTHKSVYQQRNNDETRKTERLSTTGTQTRGFGCGYRLLCAVFFILRSSSF